MKRKFSTISTIDLDKPHSWQNPSFITLDIDWCRDEVLAYSINLLEQAGASATWLVTHDTPLLERLSDKIRFSAHYCQSTFSRFKSSLFFIFKHALYR